ncbi:hypothetical protein WA171_007207 [Blastocystis sp. BT1]
MSSIPPVASLALFVDKPVLVVLLDGIHLYGILRSVDQYGNFVIDNCFERVFRDFYYTENQLGLQIVQGNNTCLISDINGSLQSCPIEGMQLLSNEEFIEYINLPDEEKMKRNQGKSCRFASNEDYTIRLATV